jgi:hypothetical protein
MIQKFVLLLVWTLGACQIFQGRQTEYYSPEPWDSSTRRLLPAAICA